MVHCVISLFKINKYPNSMFFTVLNIWDFFCEAYDMDIFARNGYGKENFLKSEKMYL